MWMVFTGLSADDKCFTWSSSAFALNPTPVLPLFLQEMINCAFTGMTWEARA